MIQRVVGPAMQGAAWVREAALCGLSRLGLEAIDLWGRSRAALGRALRVPRIPFRLRLPSLGGRSRAAAAVAEAGPRLAAGALDLALVGAVALVVMLIHREVYSQMLARPEYRPRLEALRMAYRPAWAPQETICVGVPVDAQLARQARDGDPGLVTGVARRLEANPWVRHVAEVRRVWPGRIEARVELRRPRAVVRTGARGILIDAEGIRLPDLRAGAILPAGCYEIAGVDGAAPPVGDAWVHPGVRGALDVIRALEDYRVDRVLMIVGIDVSNIGGRLDPRESEIVCWTASGVPVAWGRAAGPETYGENEVRVKMSHLALALEAFPALRGLERVDLRFDRVVVRPRPEWRVVASAGSPN